MTYAVKETYLTLQGEGAQAGRATVLCRMAGCNLWSGREADRATAVCRFCDTEFVGTDGPGGGRFDDPATLAAHIRACWDAGTAGGRPYVVFTGGEPLLQLDEDLVAACHTLGLEVGLETNGTLPAPPGIDWICVSPKAGAPLVQTHGHELKLVVPQAGLAPASLEDLAFDHFWVQPCDGPEIEANTAFAIAYCLAHPHWRLSLQTHKLLGLR